LSRHAATLILVLGGLLLTPGAAGTAPDVPGDPTPPVVTPVISGTLGLNGWYVTTVTVSWSIVDPESIILSTDGCDTKTFPADTTGITLTCKAESDGGITTVSKTFKVDKTAPNASAGPDRSADASGWYNHSLTVGFSGSDATSGLDACSSPKTYAGPDSANATVTGSCTDKAGNSASASLGLKYDATPPQNNGGSPSRGADANGWYNHAFSVTFSGSDATSGVDSCTEVTYSGPDDPSTSVSGSCRDIAGNQSGSKTFALKYDETDPAVTGKSPSRQPDSKGWYNHAVTVTFSGSDATSGVDACTQTTYAGPDAVAASVPGTCRDRAGNESGSSALTLAYDATVPQVNGTPSRPTDANGWYNHALSVSFGGSDATSGVDACVPAQSYSGPDSATASVSGTCTDNAGNTGSRSVALKYDQTAPGVTPAPARSPDANGWYNHSLSVSFSGSDATSGVDTCSAPQSYSGPDSATASVSGSCSDKAGNSTPKSLGLKYDATNPQVTAVPSRVADSNGWYNHALTVGFQGSDATSGVDSCTQAAYSGPDSETASVPGSCRDKAANQSVTSTFALKYDATAPVMAQPAPSRDPDANGWYNHALSVTFNGQDATSKLDSCVPPQGYSGPDRTNASVGGTCRDLAGNVSTRSFAFGYDATAPAGVAGAPARPPDENGWYNGAVTIDFTGDDATSGLDACTRLTYGGPDSSTASATGSCRDRAGNTSSSSSFGFKYDATEPVVTGAVALRPPDHAGWYNRPVAFTVQGNDGTAGIESCPQAVYGGPDAADAAVDGACFDKAGNRGSKAFPLRYDAAGPAVVVAATRPPDRNGWYNHAVEVDLSGSDAVAGLESCVQPDDYAGPDNGSAAVVGTCFDRAGNVGAGTLALSYDATAPQLTGAHADRQADANGWYNRPLVVEFSGVDPVSQVEACTRTSYGGPDAASVSLSGSCRDRAGNESAAGSFGLRYDGSAPTVGRLKVTAGNRSAVLSWTASDDTSLVEVARSVVGRAGQRVVYRGAGRTFTDTQLENGVRYRWRLTGYDEARNEASSSAEALPLAPLYGPAAGAKVVAPPLLAWKAVPKATYYNVQLWRHRRILSAWPGSTSLRLARSWTYEGRRYRLEPGRYRWYVWPGLGPRAAKKYGRLIGSSTFVVVAPKRATR
jgi:hypothetical protein